MNQIGPLLEVLVSFCCFPENWQTRMLRQVEKVSVGHSKRIEAEKLTLGQLSIQHGDFEAQAMIDEGEVAPVPGTEKSKFPKYVRVGEIELLNLDRIQETSTERTIKTCFKPSHNILF